MNVHELIVELSQFDPDLVVTAARHGADGVVTRADLEDGVVRLSNDGEG